MDRNLREVTRIPICCLEKGRKYQVEIQGNEVVISKEVGWETVWEDITKSCYLDFRDSRHCDGRYIAVMYKGKFGILLAAVIGTQGIQTQHGFKVEEPARAHTSFNIFRKTRGRR